MIFKLDTKGEEFLYSRKQAEEVLNDFWDMHSDELIECYSSEDKIIIMIDEKVEGGITAFVTSFLNDFCSKLEEKSIKKDFLNKVEFASESNDIMEMFKQEKIDILEEHE